MSHVVESLLHISPAVILAVMGLLVLIEDALFFGFVFPGETSIIVAGVAASRGQVPLLAVMIVAIVAAVAGDSIGYEIGRHFGPRVLGSRILRKHQSKLEGAQERLRTKGGMAVFLARFFAFLRAVMPALAGTSRMPYRTFVTWNALGGIVWAGGFSLVGYLAGDSYHTVERFIGTGSAIVAAVLVVVAIVGWHVWRKRSRRNSKPRSDRSRERARI